MRMFLTAFGLHNPYAGLRLQAHGPIPIANETQGGLDLDYSAISIAESFVIDKTAYEYVKDRRNWFLGPMCHSLEVLAAEGLLEVADFSEPLTKYRTQILEKTEQMLEAVDPWLSIGRKQWALVKSEFEEFAHLHSHPEERAYDAAHYGVVSYLERRYGRFEATEAARLHAILESRKRRLSAAEEEEMRRVLQPLVAQVLMNDLLRRWLNAPFLDWDDAQSFHDRLHLTQWPGFEDQNTASGQIANQARCLFQTVLPELLPDRIEDVVKFLHNRKAVRSLREELWDSLQRGESVSKEWIIKLHKEAASAQLHAGRRGRVIKWIGRAADLLLPGAGTAGEMLIEEAEHSAEAISEHSARSRFEWYYVLQRIKMESGG